MMEQNPKAPGPKNPDYKIEGEFFDCYSPDKGTRVRNMHRAIEKKVQDGQADRIVVNLDDWDGHVDSLRQSLADYPIRGLKEVKVVRNGSVLDIYP